MTQGNAYNFSIPAIAYTPIDALNRAAAAVGSYRTAMLSRSANYNGHRITVEYNSFRKNWVAFYYYGGHFYLARGSFQEAIKAAFNYMKRGALGSSVRITLRVTDNGFDDAFDFCCKHDAIQNKEWEREDSLDWWTWQHDVAGSSVKDSCRPYSNTILFDWDIMQCSFNKEDYIQNLKEIHGRSHA